MSCLAPLDAAVLTDYWLALMPEAEVDAVDEHLLACDACGARLRQAIALVEGVRRVAREGTLRMVVSEAFVQQGIGQGLHVRRYDLPAGGSVQCTVTADDDWLVGRLAADLGGRGRVDLAFCDAHGVEHDRLQDIPVAEGADAVVFHESMAFAKASATQTIVARLIRVDEAHPGTERVVAEYTFNHTRSLPGPGMLPG